ncbi:MAG: Fe-S protein, partial [Acidimicrobiaceae bacterium]|nr:Fe-S protein [Acidimicrobiaceae bacterium]
MRLFSHRKRPVHLGPYPLERLPRLDSAGAAPPGSGAGPLPPRPGEVEPAGPRSALHAYQLYLDLFGSLGHGEVAPEAPSPADPVEISDNLKAGLYFLDADMVGCGLIGDEAWTGERRNHRYAVVTLIAFSRKLPGEFPGDGWIDGTRQVNADLRAAELAVITASYIRNLGHDAVAHMPGCTDLDLDRVALQAGLVEVRGSELRAPYLKGGFALSVVSTDWELAPDRPLARRGPLAALRSTGGPG